MLAGFLSIKKLCRYREVIYISVLKCWSSIWNVQPVKLFAVTAVVFFASYALNGVASEQAVFASVDESKQVPKSQPIYKNSPIAELIGGAKLSPLTPEESLPDPIIIPHQPLIIQFWASWCHSCGTVLWDMDALIKQFPDTQYLSVSIDEQQENAATAVEQHPLNQRYKGHFFHDGAEVLKDYFDVLSVPTIIIVDAEGGVAHRHVGHLNATDQLHFVKLLKAM